MGRQETEAVRYGRSLLSDIGEALCTLGNSLGDEFQTAVHWLLARDSTSRVIVTGVGKAGLIGQKVAATLSSIGVPAFCLHPSDALHGDIGRVGSTDIVIIFSYSGETGEVVRLLPFLKRSGARCLAVTRSRESTLGQHAELTIELGTIREAGPLSLAPTTSTTLMLGVGDALAMTYLHERGFTEEQFAAFHPAGLIGTRLLLVGEVMRTGERHCIVSDTQSCREVIQAMSRTPGRPGAATVTDAQGRVSGIFTDGDLRRCLSSEHTFLDDAVAKHMGKSPKWIAATELIDRALHLLTTNEIDQLIVMDGEKKPLGMLDIQDILTANR